MEVRIRIYEARSQRDQETLLRLTNEEIIKTKPKPFPTEINVLTSQTEQVLTVIAVEPVKALWDWDPGFDPFRVKMVFNQIH